MHHDYSYITLAVGCVWLLLNLAAIASFTTLFYLEQAIFLFRLRRSRKTARLAPVICITSR